MRKIIPVVTAGVTTLAVAGGTFGYASVRKDVTLSLDGASRSVTSMSSTVSDVLEAEGIAVTDRDVVAPALNVKIADGTRIAVQFGREVSVTVDGQQQSFWTTATDVDQALTALGINSDGADLSTSRSAAIGRRGLTFDLATMKTITINAAGQKRQLKTTAQTVAEVLKAAKITVDANDRLSVKKTARLTNGGSFAYTRVDVKTVTEKERIAYRTVRRNSSTLDQGVTRIDTEGQRGTRTSTFSEVRHDGKVTGRTKTISKITTPPVPRVIVVGTKVEQELTRPPKTTSSSKTSASSKTSDSSSNPDSSNSSGFSKSSGSSKSPGSSRNSGSPNASSSSKTTGSSQTTTASGGVWDKIAQCESGGNWAINTGNGFYGGLQFTMSTWRGFGGTGMPQNASRETQIAVAKRIQDSQGWGAWPACTSKLGLR